MPQGWTITVSFKGACTDPHCETSPTYVMAIVRAEHMMRAGVWVDSSRLLPPSSIDLITLSETST